LRQWLQGVIDAERGCAGEPPTSMIAGSANAPEFNYWLMRAANPELTGTEVLELFGYHGSFLVSPLSDPLALRLRRLDPLALPTQDWHAAALAAAGDRGASGARGGSAAERQFLVVIGHKTVGWVEDRYVGYFPDVRPLEETLRRRLESVCHARVYDGRFALIRFPMAPTR
jgi:hypothetical protein